MKNPRRLPGILDVTYQTLPERELFWNMGIPGIFLSWSGNSSAFSRIRRGRFQKSSKLQKNSRSGRVWSVTSRITGKGRGFFIILYKHFLQCTVCSIHFRTKLRAWVYRTWTATLQKFGILHRKFLVEDKIRLFLQQGFSFKIGRQPIK